MANNAAEAVIGAVVIAAAVGFAVYAGRSSDIRFGRESYVLTASFRSADGISVGSEVRLAGIGIGTVTDLALDPQSYQARAVLSVDEALQIPEDSDVKIATEGLLGGSYVEITPGASDFMLASGDEIVNTQGAVNLLNLLMRFGTGQ
jgi:phospholipid/cholesterol/gamma-HCH transport system substrate-binding protein